MPVVSGGGAAGAVSSLYATTLVASSATIDTGAAGVAASASHLLIVCSLRTDLAANASDQLRIRFNNDSAAHYAGEIITSSGTTVAAAQDSAAVAGIYAECPASTATAAFFGNMVIWVPDYTSTTKCFTWTAQNGYVKSIGAGNLFNYNSHGTYNQTGAAITRVSVVSSNGANFIAGCRMTVYGLA